MVERRDELINELVSDTALNAYRPLAYGRKAGRWGQGLGDAGRPPEPFDAGRGENDGVEFAFIQFSQTGIEVPPKLYDLQVRPYVEELAGAPQAARSYRSPGRQAFKIPNSEFEI